MSVLGPNPSGLCQCGCGARTAPARQTRRERVDVAGQPVRFLPKHGAGRRRRQGPDYVIDPATGCWVWQHAKVDGYGAVWKDGRSQLAHRVMFEAENGPVREGLDLDHLCRNRACVNPAHLEIVTRTVNARRGAKTCLSAAAVHAIRQSTEPWSALARRYGVSKSAIQGVKTRRTWRDV